MASVISAAMDKFDGLTAAGFPASTRPKIYLDDAALAASGSQVRPPYAVLTDEGEAPDNAFGESVIETTRFKLTLYYASLADADTAALCVRFDGGTHTGKAGFDFGTLTVPSGFTFLSLVRTGSRRFLAGNGTSGERIHAVELSYVAEVQA
jgi:hypothetical protein